MFFHNITKNQSVYSLSCNVYYWAQFAVELCTSGCDWSTRLASQLIRLYMWFVSAPTLGHRQSQLYRDFWPQSRVTNSASSSVLLFKCRAYHNSSYLLAKSYWGCGVTDWGNNQSDEVLLPVNLEGTSLTNYIWHLMIVLHYWPFLLFPLWLPITMNIILYSTSTSVTLNKAVQQQH